MNDINTKAEIFGSWPFYLTVAVADFVLKVRLSEHDPVMVLL